MTSRVSEARSHVLEAIRNGLAPGSPVSIKVTAEQLRMSTTPVREALERLVGEGLLVATRDRHGFAVPILSVRDVAHLHSLFGTLLRSMLGPPVIDTQEPWSPESDDPVGSIETAIAAACRAAPNAMAAAMLRSTDLRLATYRLAEPRALEGWSQGLIDLRNGLVRGGSSAVLAVDEFTSPRISAAQSIVAAVEDMHAASASDSFRI